MSCPAPKKSIADMHRAIAAAHLELADALDDDADPGVAPPALPKPARRRGPRIPRDVQPLTDDERVRLARAGGIVGG